MAASKIEGTGIGLTISQHVIEAMRGEESIFRLEIPIADGDASPAGDYGV